VGERTVLTPSATIVKLTLELENEVANAFAEALRSCYGIHDTLRAAATSWNVYAQQYGTVSWMNITQQNTGVHGLERVRAPQATEVANETENERIS
jgi:hypothetical protein